MVALLRSRACLHLEVLALRHQLAVLQGGGRRPRLKPAERLLWSWLSRTWSGWQDALVFVKPSTVISWQRKRFRDHRTRLSQPGTPGRPRIAPEIRDLIRKISRANPSWGSPRIQSELRKLGIDVAKSTVEKYRIRPRKPPSPTWRAFLANHMGELVSLDFFTVSTVRFHVLFVLILLAHDRRRIVHFNITQDPTARWTAQQLVEAFPWDSAPRFLLRDRDGVYGADFRRRVQSMGMKEVIIAARSPWQTSYVERMIGSTAATQDILHSARCNCDAPKSRSLAQTPQAAIRFAFIRSSRALTRAAARSMTTCPGQILGTSRHCLHFLTTGPDEPARYARVSPLTREPRWAHCKSSPCGFSESDRCETAELFSSLPPLVQTPMILQT